jgi:hypothetical protein
MREGWSGSLAQYGWEFGRNVVGLSRRPTDRSAWMEVTHLSSTTYSRSVVPNTGASPLAIVHGQIYANYQGTKSKWLGGKFVAVSDDEWDGAVRVMKGGSFRDIDPGSIVLQLTLTGRPVTVSIVQNQNRKTIHAELPSKERLTLLDLSTTRTEVDATAYHQAFLQSR